MSRKPVSKCPSTAARRRPGESGMTLIEILVVITILGLIATALAYNIFSGAASAKQKLAKTGIRQLQSAIKLYQMDHGRMPEALDQLLHPPEGGQSSYINGAENLSDPWGNEYQYRTLGNGEIEITSYGADGQPGGTGENKDIGIGEGEPGSGQ